MPGFFISGKGIRMKMYNNTSNPNAEASNKKDGIPLGCC